MTRIGRNDKCPCGSEKKYKQCCLIKEEELKKKELDNYTNGQETSTEYVNLIMEYLRGEYTDHKIIDITDDISKDKYRPYQIKNYTSKIIMVAEKTEKNKDVFEGRGPTDNDIIIMYRGSFRTFKRTDLANSAHSIDKMIQTRLAGKDDK